MDSNTIIAIAALVSAAIALGALVHSAVTQRRTADENRKNNTINAFNSLQDNVLDKMVSIAEDDIAAIVENKDDGVKVKEAYNGYRTLVARCEHFAVGVNSGVYDINLVNDLGGKHLIYLYQKVLPVIDEARTHDDTAYKEFEKMVTALYKLRGIE